MWTVIDPNTHVMTVVGGSLYRFSDERGHSLCFVPFVQAPSFGSHWSPPLSPGYSTSLPVGGH